jgi:hypothetical protein
MNRQQKTLKKMKKIFSWNLFTDAIDSNRLNTNTFHIVSKISPGTISAWKNVKSIKKIEHRQAIERILGVKYDDLCVDENARTILHSTDLKPATREETTEELILSISAGQTH